MCVSVGDCDGVMVCVSVVGWIAGLVGWWRRVLVGGRVCCGLACECVWLWRADGLVCWCVGGLTDWFDGWWWHGVSVCGLLVCCRGGVFVTVWWWIGVVGVVGALVCWGGGVCVGLPVCVG